MKALIRLRGCPGWSAPLLFAYGIKQVFSWCGSYIIMDLEEAWSSVELLHMRIRGITNEPPHDKTNKMACVPSDASDQPGQIFAVHIKKAQVLSGPLSTKRRLWSDWVDAQADLSLRWAHMPFCWFCHEVAQIARFCWGNPNEYPQHIWSPFSLSWLIFWD